VSKILKNQTLSAIFIADTGITVPASPATYTIPAEDWLIWAASSDIITEVGAGNIVVSDSLNDLNISDGIDLLKFINTELLYDDPPTLEEVSLPTANTEVSHALPAGTKRFVIQNRDDGMLKLAYVATESGTKYMTIPPGGVYERDRLKGGTITVYLQSPKAAQTVVIESET